MKIFRKLLILKKTFIKVFLCAALVFLPGCITKFLWGDKSYEEKIEQFFIGSDGRYVVLIGESYHYVFTDNSGVLKEVLSLRQQGILSIDVKKTYLKVDDKNDIQGDFAVSGPFSILAFEDRQILRSLGFAPDRDDNITVKVKLSGRRYAARYLGQNLSKLSSTQVLPIYYKDKNSVAAGVGKAAVTPIAVTLDAVLLIGRVVIYPMSL